MVSDCECRWKNVFCKNVKLTSDFETLFLVRFHSQSTRLTLQILFLIELMIIPNAKKFSAILSVDCDGKRILPQFGACA